jgi:mannose-6-phosphate isomerase-like protein (cupin superfamily)
VCALPLLLSTCDDAAMGYSWTSVDDLEYEERPPKPGEEARTTADLTTALGLEQSRARLWRYPAHATGRRHRDHVQEEVFVVVSGMLTALLGDEPERVDVGPGGVVRVAPMTALQLRNEGDDELMFFAYGAPPIQEGADFLDDVELPARN